MIITDPAAAGGVVETTRAALRAVPPGRVCVQVRDKSARPRELADLGRSLSEVTRVAGAALLVNDRADVARAIGADGVHLPEGAMDPADVRGVLGPDALVGVSCHDGLGLARAEREGADYVCLAPFGEVAGKGPALGFRRFESLVQSVRTPVLALGAIDADRVPAALEAGAHGVAVIRAVYAATDPGGAVRQLLEALDRATDAGAGR